MRLIPHGDLVAESLMPAVGTRSGVGGRAHGTMHDGRASWPVGHPSSCAKYYETRLPRGPHGRSGWATRQRRRVQERHGANLPFSSASRRRAAGSRRTHESPASFAMSIAAAVAGTDRSSRICLGLRCGGPGETRAQPFCNPPRKIRPCPAPVCECPCFCQAVSGREMDCPTEGRLSFSRLQAGNPVMQSAARIYPLSTGTAWLCLLSRRVSCSVAVRPPPGARAGAAASDERRDSRGCVRCACLTRPHMFSRSGATGPRGTKLSRYPGTVLAHLTLSTPPRCLPIPPSYRGPRRFVDPPAARHQLCALRRRDDARKKPAQPRRIRAPRCEQSTNSGRGFDGQSLSA